MQKIWFPVQTCRPEGLRHTLMQICHDQPHAGHFSYQKTLKKIQDQWYWPGMHNDTKVYCNNCHTCALVNLPHNTRPAPLIPRKIPTHFGDTIAADLLGPLPQSSLGNKYLLVVSDTYSKWVELIPLQNKTAEHTAIKLYENWIAVHGCFNTLVTDQGFEFNNKVMKALEERFGFKHILTSVAHPQGNGLIENHNRMILNYFRKHLNGTNFWQELLPSVKLAYNTSVHSSTHHTPFFLTYNRRPMLPHHIKGAPKFINPTPRDLADRLRALSNTQQNMQSIFADAFHTQKTQFDKRASDKLISPGDRIYVLKPHSGPQMQKLQVIYKGPFTVIKVYDNYNLDYYNENTGKSHRCHFNNVKLAPYIEQHWTTFTPPDPPPEPEPELPAPKFTPPSLEQLIAWEDEENANAGCSRRSHGGTSGAPAGGNRSPSFQAPTHTHTFSPSPSNSSTPPEAHISPQPSTSRGWIPLPVTPEIQDQLEQVAQGANLRIHMSPQEYQRILKQQTKTARRGASLAQAESPARPGPSSDAPSHFQRTFSFAKKLLPPKKFTSSENSDPSLIPPSHSHGTRSSNTELRMLSTFHNKSGQGYQSKPLNFQK